MMYMSTKKKRIGSIAKKFGSNLSKEEPIIDEITRVSILTLSEHLKDHGYNVPKEDFEVEIEISRF